MLRRILFITSILIAVPLGAQAQGRNTITGFVFGIDKKPVERAMVDLLDDGFSSKQRIQTDTSGRFVFTNIGYGRYQIRVQVPGSDYREQAQDVELTSGRYETVQLEFRLKPRETAATIAAANVVYFQEIPAEAKLAFTAAQKEFEKNRPDAGIEQLQAALKIFPTYFAALERLGVEYMKKKQYEDARQTFTAAVAVNERSFNGWYGLSYANMATERFDDALTTAEKAVTLDKEAPEVYFVLGMSQRRLKQYDTAEKSFVKAKELDKGRTPDINWNLALLYAHNLQQYGKAADELELFLKATQGNPDAANIKKLIANFRSKQSGSK